MLITSGGIEGLQLLARTLIEPGDRVLVEAPTYLGAIMAFAGFEADVEGVRIDADGLRIEDVEAALSSGRPPKLLYVIPDHQNPSGLSLSPQRRQQLVELCRRHGLLIVEDVAYRELGFEGQAAPSLWSLAPDVVVQLGTFSKILAPGMRLGWAVGPSSLIGAMTAAKQNSDQCAGALGQTIMAEYVTAGHLDSTLRTARALYGRRAQAMLDALATHMPEGVTLDPPGGGLLRLAHRTGARRHPRPRRARRPAGRGLRARRAVLHRHPWRQPDAPVLQPCRRRLDRRGHPAAGHPDPGRAMSDPFDVRVRAAMPENRFLQPGEQS